MVLSFSFLKDWFEPWRAYLAEFLGTFVFVLISSGAVLTNIFYGGLGDLGIASAAGLTLTAMIYATLRISGGHLNPAITLALWLAQRIRGTLAIFYIFSQILASLVAVTTLLFIFGEKAREFSLGGPLLGAGISQQTGFILEAILTAVLIWAFFATIVNQGNVGFGPLVVGLVVLISTIFAGPLTGAALNPARALGPAIVITPYEDLAIWIVGPAMGSLFGILYNLLFLRRGKR